MTSNKKFQFENEATLSLKEIKQMYDSFINPGGWERESNTYFLIGQIFLIGQDSFFNLPGCVLKYF